MVNAVFDWEWTEKITMYGGAGIGQAVRLDFDSLSDADRNFRLEDETALAVQGKIGLRYSLGGSATWSFGYRYLQTEDLELRDEDVFGDYRSFDLANHQHVLEFGIGWGY